MNFSNLPKEKRTSVLVVAVVTVVVLVALGFGLIQRQYASLRETAEKIEIAQKRLKQVHNAIRRADQIELEFSAKNKSLAEQEELMASGDIYSWAVNALRRFKLPYKVEIPQISQPTPPGDVNLLPRFPYKQVTLRVGGTACFHDLGTFIADFENQFSHIRVANLTLEPSPGVGGAEKEKLAFAMDIIALVKPSAP
jgi:hypothetical protein